MEFAAKLSQGTVLTHMVPRSVRSTSAEQVSFPGFQQIDVFDSGPHRFHLDSVCQPASGKRQKTSLLESGVIVR